MENLSDKIKFFQSLKEQDSPSVLRTSSVRTTSKLKIPEIFVSNDSDAKNETPKQSIEKNKILAVANLDKTISLSVDCNLNLINSEPKPIFRTHSQSVLVDHVEDIIYAEESSEKRDSGLHKSEGLEDLTMVTSEDNETGIHKSKGFENLPLATLKNESIVPEDDILSVQEDKKEKPKICNVIPKKIEIIITDDTNIEFQKRAKQMDVNRPHSLNFYDPKVKHISQKVNQGSLYIEKLNEIKRKPRSADYDIPRTFVFNFIGKNKDRSQSVNNLSTITDETLVDSFHTSSDDVFLQSKESVTQKSDGYKKGLKIIPKEMRMRNIQDKNNTKEEEAVSSNKSILSEKEEENTLEPYEENHNTKDEVSIDYNNSILSTKEEEATHESHEGNTEEYDNTKEEVAVDSNKSILYTEEEKENTHESYEKNNEVSENNDSLPVPAPRNIPSPLFVQNEEYMTGTDLKLLKIEQEGQPVDDIEVTAFENAEYMTKNDLEVLTNIDDIKSNEEFLEMPKPAPRRHLSTTTLENDHTVS